jgi:foldase protein PrsA
VAVDNSHRSQFGSPATRDIRIVLTKTQSQANAAKHALTSGQSWDKVVKTYSIDPTTKNTGGLLAHQAKGQADPALDKAAFSAPLDKLLGPVKGQFGYYVFEVTKITAGKQQTLAQATPLIRQTLTGQQQTNAQTALTKVLRQHWLSKTSCRAGYKMTNYCPGYQAPKTSTTAGG